MKDATGELSMTAIAVGAIAIVGVLFMTLIYPNIKNSLLRSSLCGSSYGCVCTSNTAQTCTCKVTLDGGSTSTLDCDNPNYKQTP